MKLTDTHKDEIRTWFKGGLDMYFPYLEKKLSAIANLSSYEDIRLKHSYLKQYINEHQGKSLNTIDEYVISYVNYNKLDEDSMYEFVHSEINKNYPLFGGYLKASCLLDLIARIRAVEVMADIFFEPPSSSDSLQPKDLLHMYFERNVEKCSYYFYPSDLDDDINMHVSKVFGNTDTCFYFVNEI